MESLLYFVVWGALLFLMMRFGCGAHIMGHGEGRPSSEETERRGGGAARWIPPKSDFDPVCDKIVRPEDALSSVYDGHVYYFCGARCRESFEASPEHFLAKSRTPPTAAIEAPHV